MGPDCRRSRARASAVVGDDLINCASCERYGERHGDAASAELSAERGGGQRILSDDRQRANLTGSARGEPAYGPPGEQLIGSRGGI
jgi:hypothetical protein